jgi:prefoldin subunit 5
MNEEVMNTEALVTQLTMLEEQIQQLRRSNEDLRMCVRKMQHAMEDMVGDCEKVVMESYKNLP